MPNMNCEDAIILLTPEHQRNSILRRVKFELAGVEAAYNKLREMDELFHCKDYDKALRHLRKAKNRLHTVVKKIVKEKDIVNLYE